MGDLRLPPTLTPSRAQKKRYRPPKPGIHRVGREGVQDAHGSKNRPGIRPRKWLLVWDFLRYAVMAVQTCAWRRCASKIFRRPMRPAWFTWAARRCPPGEQRADLLRVVANGHSLLEPGQVRRDDQPETSSHPDCRPIARRVRRNRPGAARSEPLRTGGRSGARRRYAGSRGAGRWWCAAPASPRAAG